MIILVSELRLEGFVHIVGQECWQVNKIDYLGEGIVYTLGIWKESSRRAIAQGDY